MVACVMGDLSGSARRTDVAHSSGADEGREAGWGAGSRGSGVAASGGPGAPRGSDPGRGASGEQERGREGGDVAAAGVAFGVERVAYLRHRSGAGASAASARTATPPTGGTTSVARVGDRDDAATDGQDGDERQEEREGAGAHLSSLTDGVGANRADARRLAAGGLLRRRLLGGGPSSRWSSSPLPSWRARPSWPVAFFADGLLGRRGLLGRCLLRRPSWRALPVSTASLNALSGVTRALARRLDADRLAGLRVAAHACRAVDPGELGEAADHHGLALRDGLGDRVDEGLQVGVGRALVGVECARRARRRGLCGSWWLLLVCRGVSKGVQHATERAGTPASWPHFAYMAP